MIAWEKAVLSSSDLKELWLGQSPDYRFYLYRREEEWTGEAWKLGHHGTLCLFKERGSRDELEAKLEALPGGIQCDL
jgi:hypothetical protein